MSYNYLEDVRKHKRNMVKISTYLSSIIQTRFKDHDKSKLFGIELSFGTKYPPVKDVEFRSPEYNTYLELMKPAKMMHYVHNDHHIEHHMDDISNMNLLQIIEMISDWYCSTEDIRSSIYQNKLVYNLSDDIVSILTNTIDLFDKSKLYDKMIKYRY